MQFGVHIFPTQHSIQPDELARAVEERGLDSLWFSEHTHIPLRFLNAPGRGRTLPAYYWQTYDIFFAMTLAAAATQHIKIASGVSLVIEHDPILLAKSTATLDLLSKGRLFWRWAGWLQSKWLTGVVYAGAFNF
jgi:alkanesulfonate monooxygenase SsuD/methylene tetrahydromethanopterin reductase-like flavin-dependent oxidoreductase (luciferase family)